MTGTSRGVALDPGVSQYIPAEWGALREGAPGLSRKDPGINPGVVKFTLNVIPAVRKLVLTAYVSVF